MTHYIWNWVRDSCICLTLVRVTHNICMIHDFDGPIVWRDLVRDLSYVHESVRDAWHMNAVYLVWSHSLVRLRSWPITFEIEFVTHKSVCLWFVTHNTCMMYDIYGPIIWWDLVRDSSYVYGFVTNSTCMLYNVFGREGGGWFRPQHAG